MDSDCRDGKFLGDTFTHSAFPLGNFNIHLRVADSNCRPEPKTVLFKTERRVAIPKVNIVNIDAGLHSGTEIKYGIINIEGNIYVSCLNLV